MTSVKYIFWVGLSFFLPFFGCVKNVHPDPESIRPAALRGDWQTVCKTYQYLLDKEIGNYFPGGTGYVYRGNWLKYSTNQRFIPSDRIAFEILKIWWKKRHQQQQNIQYGYVKEEKIDIIYPNPLPDITSVYENSLPEYLKTAENVLIFDQPSRKRETSKAPILIALHRTFLKNIETPDETAKTFAKFFAAWDQILDELMIKNIAGINNKQKFRIIFEIKLLLIKLGIEIYWWLPSESKVNQDEIIKTLRNSGLIKKEYKITNASLKPKLKTDLLLLLLAIPKYHKSYSTNNLVLSEKPLFSLVSLAELKDLKIAFDIENDDETTEDNQKNDTAEPQTKPAEPQTKPAEPQTKPAEPQTKPAEPQTKPKD